jgi:putative acetyltransferase
MRIRREQQTDIEGIRAVNLAAFGSPTEAHIVDALRHDPGVLSLIAEEAGNVVGHIMFSPVQVRAVRDIRAVALAPMAVHPEHQRAGVGSALIRAGLEECRGLGIHAVFVVGHPTYYPRFGFRLASRAGFACEFAVPDEAFMVAELIPNVLAGNSGTIHFHEAFNEA